jgi:hypothetical protein
MKRFFAVLAVIAATIPALAQRRAYPPYAGRWDLNIETPAGRYPSGLEVSDRDGLVTVLFVGKEGGLHGSDHVRLEVVPVSAEASKKIGSIYGFLAPAVAVPPAPGEWESLDVTLIGRMVTVVRNGVSIIDNKQIPGITGGALDSREGLPGPLYFQGDATDGIRYRNVTVSAPGR